MEQLDQVGVIDQAFARLTGPPGLLCSEFRIGDGRGGGDRQIHVPKLYVNWIHEHLPEQRAGVDIDGRATGPMGRLDPMSSLAQQLKLRWQLLNRVHDAGGILLPSDHVHVPRESRVGHMELRRQSPADHIFGSRRLHQPRHRQQGGTLVVLDLWVKHAGHPVEFEECFPCLHHELDFIK